VSLYTSGFQKIISPITEVLHYSISAEKVRDIGPEKAAQIRNNIMEELRGKLFCLKIDSAKRLDRLLFGKFLRV
jgi:hypothetical protein